MRSLLLGITFLIATAAFNGASYGQQPGPKSRWTPPELVQMSLQDIVVAKMSENGTAVMLMVPKCQTETRTRMITVTKLRQETRVREKQVGDQIVTEEYAVSVPYTETIEQSYTVCINNGMMRLTVPCAELKAWDLSANALNASTLAKRLAAPAHVLMLKTNDDFAANDPYTLSVMRPDLVILQITPDAYARHTKPQDAVPAPVSTATEPAPPAPVVDPSA